MDIPIQTSFVNRWPQPTFVAISFFDFRPMKTSHFAHYIKRNHHWLEDIIQVSTVDLYCALIYLSLLFTYS